MCIPPRLIKLNFPKKNPAMISTRVPSLYLLFAAGSLKDRTFDWQREDDRQGHPKWHLVSPRKNHGDFEWDGQKCPLNGGVTGIIYIYIYIIYIIYIALMDRYFLGVVR